MPPTTPNPAASWIPGTMSEWMTAVIVATFIYLVKAQNDRILPALSPLTEIATIVKTLPAAIKAAVKEGVEEGFREAEERRRLAHQDERRG